MKSKKEEAKKTERGFVIFDEFTDSYGSDVRVQESSSAEGPHVWIQCHNERHGHADPRYPQTATTHKDFTPHLNVQQARRVRDALDAFIAHAEEVWEPAAYLPECSKCADRGAVKRTYSAQQEMKVTEYECPAGHKWKEQRKA